MGRDPKRERRGGGEGGRGRKDVKTPTLTYLSQDLCGKYYPTFWGFFLVLRERERREERGGGEGEKGCENSNSYTHTTTDRCKRFLQAYPIEGRIPKHVQDKVKSLWWKIMYMHISMTASQKRTLTTLEAVDACLPQPGIKGFALQCNSFGLL